MRFGGDRKDLVCELCRAKTVLHLGCAAAPDTLGRLDRGEHLHILLSKVAADLYGVDIDRSGLEILRTRGFKNLYVGDMEELPSLALDKKFDVVAVPEIIEHLHNPIRTLRQLTPFLHRRSLLCITTPNALSIKFFLHALRGQEVSGPDHTLILSPATLERVLTRAGFEVVDFWGVIETYSGWRNRMSRPVLRLGLRLAPWFSDTLVVLARLRG